MDYNINLNVLFWLVGGIAAIIALIRTVRRPFDQIDDHERRIKNLEDDRAERKQTDKLILRSLNAITNHMIDGNGISELRKVRDDLQNSIIDHHK
ncbi:MAG: hypothetical protein K6F23_03660 [Solobacterium sp.]|nr:hypothetical protein [Solobacterium sp.]